MRTVPLPSRVRRVVTVLALSAVALSGSVTSQLVAAASAAAGSTVVGVASGPVPGRRRQQPAPKARHQHLRLQRPGQPGAGRSPPAGELRVYDGAHVPRRRRQRAPPPRPACRSTPATAGPTRSGGSTPTAPSPACSPASAWTSTGGGHRQQHPGRACGPATGGANQKWRTVARRRHPAADRAGQPAGQRPGLRRGDVRLERLDRQRGRGVLRRLPRRPADEVGEREHAVDEPDGRRRA